jgi:hypothetical protein
MKAGCRASNRSLSNLDVRTRLLGMLRTGFPA